MATALTPALSLPLDTSAHSTSIYVSLICCICTYLHTYFSNSLVMNGYVPATYTSNQFSISLYFINCCIYCHITKEEIHSKFHCLFVMKISATWEKQINMANNLLMNIMKKYSIFYY